ncbi:DUF1254 domain-containing protein [Bradyrhizobium japonicum]|uniref:DUF1254 domain-containing protein n=1 Tax=Bradyrhizobium japonicum TaxID=375 RepID=UPI00057C6B2C|nr:DUF1254 domain-containing protein [Bradyrhizobium japonicum]MCD9110269.1 DUF1254 domain-containing protein [Bradyrhizobium japonicum]MCD9257448.1 DUF1254 domain-containing protein [Bradyrhizobium japonicum SEMIA 5079]MCD9823509.1 DUF1254 domain-containing protein [Bradyrhizobium japonicum]MCD9895112.1 DUF1254 domain-containing protein [Bradyrhizobium japonicum]MCD9910718.1 DUF1254 domain-containing protein [Bradyrhizobium japonicum]
MDITRRSVIRSAALAATATVAGVSRAPAQSQRPGFFKAKDIAEAGFIYGLPIVMNYAVMYEYAVDRSSSQFKAPFNEIVNEHRVYTYEDTSIIAPNSDTPYSGGFLDLQAEPIIVSVPTVDLKRYYSVQLIDGNTYNYGYMGSRATGGEAGDYMIVGPEWRGTAPSGVKKVFRSGTRHSLITIRTQLFGANDMENVIKVQDGYKVRPLSTYLNQSPPTPAAAINFPKIDKQLIKTNFFEYLDFALQFIPAEANEVEIRSQLARIGVGPGKTFNFKDLSLEDKAEVALGMKEGDRKVDEAVALAGKGINGWRVGSQYGDSKFYSGDWLKRAAAARAGIYANDAVEAIYPQTRADVDGQPLDSGKHNYTLTFAADQLPPVNAFWSVTMYDGKTELLIKNPINRYLINSPMLPRLKKNADGSLTIYIQNKSPGADKEANWLPAPDGSIYLMMRLYWPKETPPSILPPGEGTWRPPGVVRVS